MDIAAVSGLDSNYNVRSYPLVANTPIALPSARQYLLVTAIDNTAVTIALGAQNSDFDPLILGIAIGVEQGSIKARIRSSISQTVTIAYTTGKATMVDSRFAPGGGTVPVTIGDGDDEALGATTDAPAATDTSNASVIALLKRMLSQGLNLEELTPTDTLFIESDVGDPTNSNLVVPAIANINGILLINYHLISSNGDPESRATLGDSTLTFAQVMVDMVVSSGHPHIIPAGQELNASTRGKCSISLRYRML